MKATATLAYSSKFINRNYRIKVYGIDESGSRVNKLVGVSGLLKLVGDISLVNRLLKRALDSMADYCICKLRRGVKITF